MGLLPADMWEVTLKELIDIVKEREMTTTNNCITTAWLAANYSRSKLKNLDHYLIKDKKQAQSQVLSKEGLEKLKAKWGF